MRPQYETSDDLRSEASVSSILATAWCADVHKVPLSYGVDYMVEREGRLCGWIEIKVRHGMVWGQYPDIMVSVLKLRAAAALKLSTGAETFLAVADSTGEVRLSCPLSAVDPAWIRFGGRTTQTRDSADVEPVAHIPLDHFRPASEVM